MMVFFLPYDLCNIAIFMFYFPPTKDMEMYVIYVSVLNQWNSLRI